MTPEKPETPVSEQLQVKLANEMHTQSRRAKGAIRGDFLATSRRDERSSTMSRVSGESAKQNLAQLKEARKKDVMATVDGAIERKSAGVLATGKGGRSYGSEGEQVRRSIDTAERTARNMSAIDHSDSMRDFVEDNERKQLGLDLAYGATAAYYYNKDKSKRPEEKIKPEDPYSAMNYSMEDRLS